MASSSSYSIISVISFTFIIFVVQIMEVSPTTTVKLPPNMRVPAVIAFGDSIVDPGNNNYVATVVRSNYVPYGRDFMGGKPTGRFSNGKIPGDLMVELLGIKNYLPPYLDPSVSPNDLLTGVSFASSGTGYDPLTAKMVSSLGLDAQLKLFKEYMEKVKAIGGEKKGRSILSESFFLIVCGSNDIANTYFTSPFRRTHYDVPAYTDLMVQGASSFFQELYGLGARRFGILSAPPIGCLPSQRTLGGGKQRACASDYNHASQLFNSKLSSELDNLNRKLPQSRFVYIDIYNPLLDVINNPDRYGFEEVSKGCCGTGLLEAGAVFCNLNPFTCKDASKYVFWDGYHPTEKTYQQLLGPVVNPGNNNYVPTVVRCNFKPYGRDFMGGKPTGRFSNGKIPSDLMVETLGIKSDLPAYLDPSVSPNDLLTGVSFASGGAGYDSLTAKIVSAVGLQAQIELFKEYMEKVKGIGGEEKARSILSESIYLIVCGSDDIANTYLTTPFRKPQYDVPAYTDLMVQGASSFFQELYGLGARGVGILSAPPIGCVPSQRTLGGGKQRVCVTEGNHAAQLFNSKLSLELDNLNRKLPQSRFVYIDIYNPPSDIINNPSRYGFEEVSKGCCGTGKIDVVVLCNKFNPFTCKNVSRYVFWDSYHPTEKTYQQLFGPIINKYINSFF